MDDHEVIARVVELINQEPRYFSELVRIFQKEHGYSWSYWADRIGKALWILMTEDRIEKKPIGFNKLVTSTIWTPYSIYYPTDEPPIGWDEYEAKGLRKIKKLSRLSDIGLKNAEMYENMVYRVVKRIYPSAVKTDFNSPLPDIYVPEKNIIVEATTRFEYPIGRNYIEWKYYHLPKPYEKEAYHSDTPLRMLIIAPLVGKSAWDFVKRGQFREGGLYWAMKLQIPMVKVIQFPKTSPAHAGWPLFRSFAYYKKWLEEFHRKVYVLPPVKEAERKLYLAVLNALRDWEKQEDVLVNAEKDKG